ncbi:RICIN domain-containing protein [Actinomadura soli]|nr:RICIN domain-containing protein [Actinomadura soli]
MTAEFVEVARKLKAWSGLSYRQLEKRSAALGDRLPPSSLATALSRASLPSEPMLVAFVRACGGGEDMVRRWTDTRRRLAVAETGRRFPSEEAATWPPMGAFTGAVPAVSAAARARQAARRGRGSPVKVLLLGLVALLTTGHDAFVQEDGAAAKARAPRPPRAAVPALVSASGPADGWYQIHIVPGQRCMAIVARGRGAGDLAQQNCQDHHRQYFHFQRSAEDAYEVKVEIGNADFCLTVDTLTAGDNVGLRPCLRSNLSQKILVRTLADGGELLSAQLKLAAVADPGKNVQVGRPAPGGNRPREVRRGTQEFYLTEPLSPTWRGESTGPG